MGEERQDLVAGGDRRLARFVDQVGGHHAVRARHHLFEERRRVGVGRAVGEHSCDEAVAERLRVGREPLGLAEAISLEAVGHDGQVLALEAFSNRGELVGGDLQPGGVVERQRRLGQDRCEHRGLEHHREREVAREAHPDRADARTAALLVRQPRQRPQPLGHRARLVGGEGAELGADARPPEE